MSGMNGLKDLFDKFAATTGDSAANKRQARKVLALGRARGNRPRRKAVGCTVHGRS
jgi:hypothetical protein